MVRDSEQNLQHPSMCGVQMSTWVRVLTQWVLSGPRNSPTLQMVRQEVLLSAPTQGRSWLSKFPTCHVPNQRHQPMALLTCTPPSEGPL